MWYDVVAEGCVTRQVIEENSPRLQRYFGNQNARAFHVLEPKFESREHTSQYFNARIIQDSIASFSCWLTTTLILLEAGRAFTVISC